MMFEKGSPVGFFLLLFKQTNHPHNWCIDTSSLDAPPRTTNHSQRWVRCSCWCLTIADDICCFNREEIWSCWLWGKVASAGGPVWWPAITQVYHQCAADHHGGDNHYGVNDYHGSDGHHGSDDHHGGFSDHCGKDNHDGGGDWAVIHSVNQIIYALKLTRLIAFVEWKSHEKKSNLGQPSGSLGFDLVSNLENKRNLGRSSLWGPLLGQVVVFDVQTSEIKQTDAMVHKHTVEPAKTFDSPWELQTGLMGCFCSHNPWYRLCLDWKQVIYNRTESSGFRNW